VIVVVVVRGGFHASQATHLNRTALQVGHGFLTPVALRSPRVARGRTHLRAGLA
jgi:hypothetical protein